AATPDGQLPVARPSAASTSGDHPATTPAHRSRPWPADPTVPTERTPPPRTPPTGHAPERDHPASQQDHLTARSTPNKALLADTDDLARRHQRRGLACLQGTRRQRIPPRFPREHESHRKIDLVG